MSNLLDINYLRSLAVKPKWFGLGFIQLKIDPHNRMHFWHPDLQPDDPAFDEEYHDHRYDFTSNVLVGELTNEIIEVIPDEESFHGLFEVCCSGGGMSFLNDVSLDDVKFFTTKAGSSYYLHRDTFHRVHVDRCVTIQTRGADKKEKARVVQNHLNPSANPFDTSMSEKSLWEYIENLISPQVDQPGYHLREITKGVLGETSKIQEELDELVDAAEQKSRVMELVELSDLTGAIRAYMERHHPGYTMDDLAAMSAITERAFRNGRR